MTELHTPTATRPRIRRPRGYNQRTATAQDVLTIRGDEALRKKARQMLRVAQEILRRTPSLSENARRLGLTRDTAKRIVEWKTYKEVR